MRICLHIGPETRATERLHRVLADKRDRLRAEKILYPVSIGPAELCMAVTDHVDLPRHELGYETPEKQRVLHDTLIGNLRREFTQHSPDTLILVSAQLGQTLHTPQALARLQNMLAQFSSDIRIIAHVDEQARALLRHYAVQIQNGRSMSLAQECAIPASGGWWEQALKTAPATDTNAALFPDIQGTPFWLDYAALVRFWESGFGTGTVTLRAQDLDHLYSETAPDILRDAFEIAANIGKTVAEPPAPAPSAAWLTRARLLNTLFRQLVASQTRIIPPDLWRSLLDEAQIDGPPIAAGTLSAISGRFAKDNTALASAHPALSASTLSPDAPAPAPDWAEADPGMGFRASQYLLAFMYRIDKATQAARNPQTPQKKRAPVSDLSATARALMPPLAVQNFDKLRKSPYAPHNRLGALDETALAAAYDSAPTRKLPKGSSGRVIVGCMKNEAPYIVEWIAHHRAIGVDNFLIYTNDCTDGTDEILGRLQEMGIVQHRNNDKWRGKSPQQHALNMSQKEPLIRKADWIIHIDVDEFINVRTGNGTLDDFFAKVPDATNVAMTWRLFGHNGIHTLSDDLVIDQFDHCAPAYCPKPHTAWGFKTMFKNIGAYRKISCHRPNQLNEEQRDKVKWVNGSGHDMTEEVAKNGWRNSRKSIGYDLLQLNHYALRSAESFLIKRQRGRALHVDRSIGINYWIRMDWSDFRDITIKRNLPRVRAEYDRLLQDKKLRKWHDKGRAWHRAKADELHATPEFHELYEQALTIKLTETERVAYALALDMES